MSSTSKQTTRKPRLGRGLSSLISNSAAHQKHREAADYISHAPAASEKAPVEVATARSRVPAEIAVDKIAPNPYQPRREFNEEQMADLANSISEQGILQPLIVAEGETPDAFVLVAGERRLRAAKKAGLAAVPCIVRKASRQEMLEWALVENIQRSDLNPVERATAFRDYMDQFNLTQAEVGKRLGQPRATVANYLRLLDLPDEVQQMLLADELTFGHAKVLAGLAGKPKLQIALARKAARKSLSVRQLEQLSAASSPQESHIVATERKSANKAPYIRDVERQLTDSVGTRVEIRPARAKNTGKIVIDYYSLDDFDRITAALGTELNG